MSYLQSENRYILPGNIDPNTLGPVGWNTNPDGTRSWQGWYQFDASKGRDGWNWRDATPEEKGWTDLSHKKNRDIQWVLDNIAPPGGRRDQASYETNEDQRAKLYNWAEGLATTWGQWGGDKFLENPSWKDAVAKYGHDATKKSWFNYMSGYRDRPNALIPSSPFLKGQNVFQFGKRPGEGVTKGGMVGGSIMHIMDPRDGTTPLMDFGNNTPGYRRIGQELLWEPPREEGDRPFRYKDRWYDDAGARTRFWHHDREGITEEQYKINQAYTKKMMDLSARRDANNYDGPDDVWNNLSPSAKKEIGELGLTWRGNMGGEHNTSIWTADDGTTYTLYNNAYFNPASRQYENTGSGDHIIRGPDGNLIHGTYTAPIIPPNMPADAFGGSGTGTETAQSGTQANALPPGVIAEDDYVNRDDEVELPPHIGPPEGVWESLSEDARIAWTTLQLVPMDDGSNMYYSHVTGLFYSISSEGDLILSSQQPE